MSSLEKVQCKFCYLLNGLVPCAVDISASSPSKRNKALISVKVGGLLDIQCHIKHSMTSSV